MILHALQHPPACRKEKQEEEDVKEEDVKEESSKEDGSDSDRETKRLSSKDDADVRDVRYNLETLIKELVVTS